MSSPASELEDGALARPRIARVRGIGQVFPRPITAAEVPLAALRPEVTVAVPHTLASRTLPLLGMLLLLFFFYYLSDASAREQGGVGGAAAAGAGAAAAAAAAAGSQARMREFSNTQTPFQVPSLWRVQDSRTVPRPSARAAASQSESETWSLSLSLLLSLPL